VDTYYADPREGYSRGFQALLKSVGTGPEFLQAVKRTKDSNGAVMGAATLGYLPTIEEVKLAATVQAITTHHPSTAVHAQIVALSAYYFLNNDVNLSKDCLQGWLMDNVDWVDGKDDSYRWSYLVDCHDTHAGTTIKASSISSYMVYALTKFDKLSHIIYDAIDRGGDTDSAAAVAVAVASCSDEVENDIPRHLIPSSSRWPVDFENPKLTG
jgi:ADP-ribosylglycohydrolase